MELRNDFEVLSKSLIKISPKGDEGTIQAAIQRAQFKTLEDIADKILGIHNKLCAFRKHN